MTSDKNLFLTVLSVLSISLAFFHPSLLFAQENKNDLLMRAQKWADEIDDCSQYPTTLVPGQQPDQNNPPIGKCENHFETFCQLKSNNETQVILKIKGSCWPGYHGMSVCDVRYVLFSTVENKLSTKKIMSFNSNNTELKLIKFKEGPDLIWLGEEEVYNGSSTAHIFGIVDGKLEELLTYDYEEVEHQGPHEMSSELTPLANRDLKLSITEDDGENPKKHDIVYHFNTSQAKYIKAQ